MAPIYCVAGDCATEDYAKAEALAELLMSSLPKAECSLLPQLPADWEAFGAAKARALGVPLSQPLVWTGAGAPVGGLAEFEAECARKYNLHLQSMPTSAWTKIARETLAHQKLLAAGPQADEATGATGAERGRFASEKLREGNTRVVAGTSAPRPALGGVEATVVTLGPVGGAPALGQLLDVAPDALFVVPCTATGVDELTIGNAEYGAVALAAKALWIVGAPSEALTLAVSGAKAHAKCDDHPLPPAEAEILERMLPATARALAVAPPDASAEEVEAIVLDEWVRTSSDELLECSAVLAELKAAKGLDLVRCVVGAGGKLRYV